MGPSPKELDMGSSSFDVVAASGGIAFTVLGLSTIVVVPAAPEIDASAADVRSYIGDHHAAFGVSTILMALAVLSIALFLGYLHQRIAESTGRSAMTATFGMTSAGVVTLAMTGVLLQGVLGQQTATGIDDSTLLALHRIWYVVAFAGPPVLLSVALGIAAAWIVRGGVFPVWLGWVAAVSAVGGLVTGLINVGTSSRAPLVIDLGSFALACVFVSGVSIAALRQGRHAVLPPAYAAADRT
jgi:hypothetical protein